MCGQCIWKEHHEEVRNSIYAGRELQGNSTIQRWNEGFEKSQIKILNNATKQIKWIKIIIFLTGKIKKRRLIKPKYVSEARFWESAWTFRSGSETAQKSLDILKENGSKQRIWAQAAITCCRKS